MPEFGQNRLANERKTMTVYRRAFILALRNLPDPSGEAPHMLAALEALAATQDHYSDLNMALRDVTIFERNHPDMVAFGTSLGMSETQIDDLFRLAIHIENLAP